MLPKSCYPEPVLLEENPYGNLSPSTRDSSGRLEYLENPAKWRILREKSLRFTVEWSSTLTNTTRCFHSRTWISGQSGNAGLCGTTSVRLR